MGKIVMCGCTVAGWELISSLLAEGIKLDWFVCITPEKAQQQRVSGYKDFGELAAEYNIPIYYAEKYSLKGEKDLAFFSQNKFDLLIQGVWHRLFPQTVLDTLSIGAIGVHGSSDFLPKGRGRSPINWSLIEGKKRFIIHYFLIKPGIDDGDVFHYDIFDINEWDTCETLYYKNVIVSKRSMLHWIPRLLKGDYRTLPQVGMPTYYPRRTAEDGNIDWSKDLYSIYNFIRALTRPYPGAFSFVRNSQIKIWKAYPFDSRITYHDALEGEIVEKFQNKDFIVNCNSGLLLVTDYECGLPIEKGNLLRSTVEQYDFKP